MPQTPFGEKCLQEHGRGQLGQNLWSDATREKNSACGFEFQGKVSGLGAVELALATERLEVVNDL